MRPLESSDHDSLCRPIPQKPTYPWSLTSLCENNCRQQKRRRQSKPTKASIWYWSFGTHFKVIRNMSSSFMEAREWGMLQIFSWYRRTEANGRIRLFSDCNCLLVPPTTRTPTIDFCLTWCNGLGAFSRMALVKSGRMGLRKTDDKSDVKRSFLLVGWQ